MASPRSSSSGVYTSRTETGLEHRASAQKCEDVFSFGGGKQLIFSPWRSELFEPQSSASASGSNREVQAWGLW